ncbi:MAG: hypothetical protein WC734_00525 [Patescibacteria group bacterium]|jgi:hypothetical protein
MKHSVRKLTVGVISTLAVFSIVGGVTAATTFKGQGTVEFDSVKINGVTTFNGTMINTTKGTNNFDNPIAIGDNLRVDGRVYRGTTPGTTDSKPFIINDNAQIDGSLTVVGSLTSNGLPVSTTKRYDGTFDVTADGDFVSTSSYGNQCADYPTSILYYHEHMKKVAVAEASLTNPANIRVFYKPADDSVYTAGPYPNGNNAWVSAGYSQIDGYVYFTYKQVTETCGGVLTPGYYAKGEYNIIVQK